MDDIFERWKKLLSEWQDMPHDEDDGDIHEILNWFKTEANVLYDQQETDKAEILLRELMKAKVNFLSRMKRLHSD
jgi:hypothetical protein